MTFRDNFSDKNDCTLIYKQSKVPVFQNKIYETLEEALAAQVGLVELVQSRQSGFVFNNKFDPDIMNYDANYQNEQSNSMVFQEHIQFVLDLLKSFGLNNKKIIEIGCGKGIFFEKMLGEGLDCWGFDPTYEGNNPKIIKEYFSEVYNDINADVIIMRHTLEHIPNPFSFIHEIAKANNFRGHLFVEVPTFDWIVNKKAFWDIFYEHCNYFTELTLGSMFDDALTGSFFGGQYIYLWADMSKLRSEIPEQQFVKYNNLIFSETLEKYNELIRNNGSFAIWGAGAKGSTFLNLLDQERDKISYVIDINPAKQNKHIACTGHKIYPPSILETLPVQNVLVMNENYISEIKETIKKLNINIYNL
jgi:hypothetical protein